MIRKSPWPHRCAVLLVLTALLSVFTGTAVTSNQERPYYALGRSHAWLGAAIAILTIALVISSRNSEKRVWLRCASWILLSATLVQAIIGLQPLPQPPALRVVHAFVAQLFLTMAGLIALCTSPRWDRPPEYVESGRTLRFLTGCVPLVVLVQVTLGTLHRHGALGVGPHLVGAFLAAFFILGLTLPIIYRPEHHSLHLAARGYLAIAAVQVFVGFALFSMQAMDVDPATVILTTLIHAATGAMTLAATAVLALLIRRRVVPEVGE